MSDPVLPEMTDLANIRDALNLYYYGQVIPTESPTSGLSKEFGDILETISAIQTTADARKPPKIVAQTADPGSPNTTDSVGGIWIDTDASASDPLAQLGYYWDSTANSGAGGWVAFSGKASESYAYVWTASHTFKAPFNYYATSGARDTALPSPTTGMLAVVGSDLQVYNGGWKNVSVPFGGTQNQALLKGASDGSYAWSDVVRPTANNTLSGNNTFSGTNTFSGAVTFSGTPTAAALTVTGAAAAGSLSVSGTTGLATLNVSGVLTQTGQANMNGKTVVKNDTARDSGFFIGTRRLYVASSMPTGASSGDLWIQG